MGRGGSYMLYFLFIVNICMQGLFVYLLVTTSLTEAQYNSDFVAQYVAPRIEPARRTGVVDKSRLAKTQNSSPGQCHSSHRV